MIKHNNYVVFNLEIFNLNEIKLLIPQLFYCQTVFIYNFENIYIHT